MAPRQAVAILAGIGLLTVGACSGSGGGGQPLPGDAGPGAGNDVGTSVGADVARASDGGADAGTSARDDTAGPADGGGLPAWPAGKYISVDEVYARSQAGDPEMLLVNVVDPEYYNLGHIANSLKIPWDALAGRLAEVDASRHVVLYCRRGVRSESAYTTLADNGYSLVWAMEGGIERWIAAGYPTVAD